MTSPAWASDRRYRRRGHIVIGDADDVDPFLGGPFGQLVERGDGVARRHGVQMAVHPHPACPHGTPQPR